MKMAHFVLCNKMATNEETTKLFVNNVYKYYDFSNNIIFDCGTQFTSEF